MLHPSVLLFGLIVLVFIFSIFHAAVNWNAIPIILAFGCPVYLMIQIAFVYELNRAKKFLNEIFVVNIK